MDILIKLFEVLFPVFFIVGIGYYLGKKNPNLDTTFITNFGANIGSPALVFYSVTTTGITFEIFNSYFGYYFLAIIGFSIVGVFFLYLLKKDIIMELPPFILPNTGNMGLPICLFAYGAEGLGVAGAISSIIILFHFTLGVFLASKKFDFNVVAKSPSFYAIIISVLFLYFQVEIPNFVVNTTMMLTYATIFLILMSLGIALTRFKVFSFNKALISSIARVIIGPIIGFLIIKIFNLTGYAAGVLLIQCSMPSAVLNYLVGSIYSPKEIVDNIASMIVVSTILSFITLPIVVFFALKYFI
ncbi:MAG: transporter [Candidatus Pelagibacter sp. TMED64]|nr:transporter [Candidatus Pelagibacter sp.]OUU64878.1 MAG: transporter [Candidatus Pelagibacter sp. TMED64]|tara:strand:+ start:2747 stop:3646 length:900 start_codon:yes stop_codon:yes gene_type:complete